MRATFRRLLIVPFALLWACSAPPGNASRITTGAPGAAPQPITAAPNDPPQILYAQLSTMRVRRGDWWSGRVITGTNVASVVLSMPFFSFEIPRTRFGDFSFRTHVIDVPPLYRQRLYGALIAYNTAGSQTVIPVSVTFE